jgi:hypothetical protein
MSDSPTATVDTTQTTQEELSTLVANLQRLAQEWECLLFSTGGALNLEKCFWFLLAWSWDKGRAKIHNLVSAPGDLSMTSEINPKLLTVKKVEPTESYRTLGVYITPIGCNKGAITVLKEAGA